MTDKSTVKLVAMKLMHERKGYKVFLLFTWMASNSHCLNKDIYIQIILPIIMLLLVCLSEWLRS